MTEPRPGQGPGGAGSGGRLARTRRGGRVPSLGTVALATDPLTGRARDVPVLRPSRRAAAIGRAAVAPGEVFLAQNTGLPPVTPSTVPET